MALDLLFPNFGELIRTPEDVQRLNEAILQLAVQGKLVAQNPNDEPASELLKRANVSTVLSSGTTKRSQTSAVLPNIPGSWTFVSSSAVCLSINDGDHLPPPQSETGIPFLVISNIRTGKLDFRNTRYVPQEYYETLRDERKPRQGDVLYSIVGSLGTAVLIEDDVQFCFQRHMALFHPSAAIESKYLFYLLQAPAMLQQARATATGTAQLTIPMSGLRSLIFPLPPLVEQQRIVAKVNQLFAQTRALEARLRQAQEDVVTVNRAALHRLHTAQDDDQFQTAWRTLRDHFDVLYDDPRNVAELRQTILDLAVRGKLVPQDPEDEPAAELLNRIGAEKKRLVHERKIGKLKPMPSIKQSETPFELPDGWCWSRLGDVILEIQTGPFGSTLHKSDYVEGGVPVVNPANIRDGHIESLANMAVSEDTKKRLDRYVLEKGDIVMARRGEMGRCAVVTDREAGWLCGSGSFNLKTSSNMSQEFLIRLIHSPGARQYLSGGSVGSTMNNLNHRILGTMVLGVPPLAEQWRIVAKVDQLMRLCDELEAGLVNVETQRRNVTVAVLQAG